MNRPAPSTVAGLIVFPALALIPITTAYLVLVHRVVEARVLLRRTLQYGLARSTIFALRFSPSSCSWSSGTSNAAYRCRA